MTSVDDAQGGRDIQQLGDLVTQLRRALRRQMRHASPHSGLPMAQLEVLQCVAEREPVRLGEVAEELHLAINTVSTLTATLVDADLLARQPAVGDRRGVVLVTTRAGRAYLKRWQHDLEAVLVEAVAPLDAGERAALSAALPALEQVVTRLAAHDLAG